MGDGETPAPDAAPVKGIDLAFALHAGFALTLLVCAYIQIVQIHRTWLSHRRFGYVAAAAFVLHVLASLFNVYMDVVQHQWATSAHYAGCDISQQCPVHDQCPCHCDSE